MYIRIKTASLTTDCPELIDQSLVENEFKKIDVFYRRKRNKK